MRLSPETRGSLALHLLPLLLLGRGEVAVRPGAHLEVDDARLQEVARQVLQDDVALRRPKIVKSVTPSLNQIDCVIIDCVTDSEEVNKKCKIVIVIQGHFVTLQLLDTLNCKHTVH